MVAASPRRRALPAAAVPSGSSHDEDWRIASAREHRTLNSAALFLEEAQENAKRRHGCSQGFGAPAPAREAHEAGAASGGARFGREVQSKYLRTACLANHTSPRFWRPKTSAALPMAQTTPRSQRLPPLQAPERQEEPPALWVVESPASLEVSVEEGGTCAVPAHAWLVLDLATFTSGDSVGSRALSADAGGGCILEVGGAALLKVVSEERLTARAAEANLRRATRGSSVVALKHAALISKVVHETGAAEDLISPALSFRKSRERQQTPRSVKELARESDESIAAMAQRMQGIVALREAGLKQRVDQCPQTARAASSGQPAADELGSRSSSWLRKGLQALQEFNKFTHARFGSPVRAWMALDPECGQGMGEMQFARALDRVGFRGSAAALWRYLDRDSSGQITLVEMAPRTAKLLAELKHCLKEKFENSIYDVVAHLDDNGSGHIHKQEFVDGLRRLGYAGPAGRLFDIIVEPGMSFIKPEDLAFLDHWSLPLYLCIRADEAAAAALKESLLLNHKNILAAWIKALDPDRTMRVCWHEFRSFCQDFSRSPHSPPSIGEEAHMASIWRTLDDDCSGWISLRELDEEAFGLLVQLKRWAIGAGGITKALRELEGPYANKISRGRFKELLRENADIKKDVAYFVFDALEHSDHVISCADLWFLDKWDYELEELEIRMRKKCARG